MSTECEGVFSGAKNTITSGRNALNDRVIEACECLKAWWRNKVISGAIEPKTRGLKTKAEAMEEDDEVLAGLPD